MCQSNKKGSALSLWVATLSFEVLEKRYPYLPRIWKGLENKVEPRKF